MGYVVLQLAQAVRQKTEGRGFDFWSDHRDFSLTKYLLAKLLTYSLTPWNRVLLEKLTGLQLVKKFPAFHGTRRFITAFTNTRHLSLSWASSIQSIPSHPTSWRSILILYSHLRLGFPTGLFPPDFPTKNWPNTSGCSMAMGSAHCLTEISTTGQSPSLTNRCVLYQAYKPLKFTLKCTLKQIQISLTCFGLWPSSGSLHYSLAKVTFIKNSP